MNTRQGKEGQAGTMPSILVVEDSPLQARALCRMLEAHQYAVAVTQNGVEAMAQIHRQRPDLVLSDIVMPQMDGFALCDAIKKNPDWAGLPVILLTTLSDPDDIVQALSVGADDYIMKPCDEGSLLAKIAGAFDPPAEQTVRRNGQGLRVRMAGTEVVVRDDSRRILKLLLSTYENAIRQNRELTVATVENKRINKQLVCKVRELEESQKELQRLNEQLAIKMAELAASEEKYRSLVDTVPDIVYKIDPDGYFTFLNDSVEKLGYRPEELLGRHFSEIMLPADVGAVSRTTYMSGDRSGKIDNGMAPKIFDERRTGKRKTTGLEIYLLCKDYRKLPALIRSNIEQGFVVEVNSAGMYQGEPSGNSKFFVGTVGVIRDITCRKRMEEELRKSRDELQKALEDTERAREKIDAILFSVADGLIVTDLSQHVILMNPAAEELLGMSLSQVRSWPIEFAIRIPTLRDRLVNVLTEKEVGYEFDFEMPGPGKEHHRIMRGKTSAVKDSAGRQVGIVIIIADVTHEREVDRLKTEFLSTAAHELRTPLTSIQGFSEILATRDELGIEEKKRFLSYINKQAVNLANIVNDLLDISRIESGRSYTINKERCLASELIGGVVSCFREVSAIHTVVVELPDQPVELVVDHAKMGQVLKNLLSNAIKYSPAGGTIRVCGEDDEERFAVSVQDQGIGMSPEQVEKVFEKFYRVDASDSAPEGTGLGMTIVKYIVEAHGGEVIVQSEIGWGTTVRFVIPKNGLTNRNKGGRE